MGAPLVFSPIDGAIHKRAAITEQGHFMGIQWPAALVMRKSDKKIMSVSRKKIRVYESAYTCDMNQRVQTDGEVPASHESAEEVVSNDGVSLGGSGTAPRTELDKNMVQSIKSLREHRFLLPGMREVALPTSNIEKSASVYDQFGGEGDYVDDICNQKQFARLTELLEHAKDAARRGVVKPNLRSQVLEKLNAATDIANGVSQQGRLKVGKKKKKSGGVSIENVVKGKRRRLKFPRKNRSSSSVHTPQSQPDHVDEPPELVCQSDEDGDSDDDEGVVKGKRQKLKFPPQHRTSSSSVQPPQSKPIPVPPVKNFTKWKIRKGDVVSASAQIFDGDEPGSYSDSNPDRCFGQVVAVTKKGLAKVKWSASEEEQDCRVKDPKLEAKKATAARITNHRSTG